jgi:uncharacterized protein YegJ (DUF2314 family)
MFLKRNRMALFGTAFTVCLLIPPIFVLSCRRGNNPVAGSFSVFAPAHDLIGLTRQDFILPVEDEGEELAQIAEAARESFPRFVRRLQSPGPGETSFRVKYRFAAEEGSGFRDEYLWLSDIGFEQGSYYGFVANQPYYAGNLKTGDRVNFFAEDISDWMFYRDGKIVGGLSIKYLIEVIPPLDREEALNVFYQGFFPEERGYDF